MKQVLKTSYIFLFILSSFYFFSPVAIPFNTLNGILFIFLFPVLLYYLPVSFLLKKHTPIDKGVYLILLSVFLSVFGSLIIWNQPLVGTLARILLMFVYAFYFFLRREEQDIITLERMIIVIGVLSAITQFISIYVFPSVLFSGADFYNEGRGFIRILPGGGGFVFLGFFLSLYKIIKEHSKVHILFIIIFSVSIVATLTRLYLAACALLVFIYTFKYTTIWMKILFISLLLVIGYSLLQTEFVQILLEVTNSEIGSHATEYVRFDAARYFLVEFPPNLLARIIGSGVDSSGIYNLKIQYLMDQYGYYIADIGFLGLYVKYGLLAIIGYIIIYYTTIFKTGNRYDYAKYYLYFILINGFTNHATFHRDFLASLAIVFYIINFEYLRKQENDQYSPNLQEKTEY